MSFIINNQIWGYINNTNPVKLYTITNSHGVSISVTEFGARLVEFKTFNKQHQLNNIVLGFDSLEKYIHQKFYLGATIGRFCGRIASGKLNLLNKIYPLNKNSGENTLHGGANAMSHRIWGSEVIEESHRVGIKFTYHSPDGENGFPGNIQINVTYYLYQDNSVVIEHNANTSQATLLNLTNHSYYNLSGGTTNIEQHTIKLNSQECLEFNQDLIPNGQVLNFVSSPQYDFATVNNIHDYLHRINYADIDTSYLLQNNVQPSLDMQDHASGRGLLIYSNQKVLHLFTTARLQGLPLNDTTPALPFAGLAVEPQGISNANHYSHFPENIIYPNQTYNNTIRLVPYIVA